MKGHMYVLNALAGRDLGPFDLAPGKMIHVEPDVMQIVYFDYEPWTVAHALIESLAEAA